RQTAARRPASLGPCGGESREKTLRASSSRLCGPGIFPISARPAWLLRDLQPLFSIAAGEPEGSNLRQSCAARSRQERGIGGRVPLGGGPIPQASARVSQREIPPPRKLRRSMRPWNRITVRHWRARLDSL